MSKIRAVFIHFLFLGALFLSWLPFARWFYLKDPSLGVDFYLMASYVSYLKENFVLPFWGWKYIWFAGIPLISDYPALHFYLTLPFTYFFEVTRATQIYLLSTSFLFLAFSYLLFYELSKNRVLSLILSVLLGLSVSIYPSLTYGGNSTFFATQMFLPLVLWILIKYLKTLNRKFLFLAAFLTGLSFFGHSGLASFHIVPLGILTLLFWTSREIPILSFKKIKDAFIYGLISFFVGLPVILHYLIFYTTQQKLATYQQAGIGFYQRVAFVTSIIFNGIIQQTDPIILILTGSLFILFIFFILFKKQFRELKPLIYLFLIFGYLSFLLYGPQKWGGSWRMFWYFPPFFGLVVAFCWGRLKEILKGFWANKKILRLSLSLIISSILIIFGFFYWKATEPKFFFNLEKNLERADVVDKYSRINGAYPAYIRSFLPSDKIRRNVLPSWVDASDKQYRFYAMDAEYNLWFNTYFKMPLVRGYVPFITTKLENWLYWSDTSLTKDDIVNLHNIPPEIAKNYALFNIDWLSIKYLEGTDVEELQEHKIRAGRQYVMPLSSYLLKDKDKIFEKEEFWEDCHYFQVKKDLTSPIIQATNAPAVLVISDKIGYDVILKNLAMQNLNSQYLVPISGSQYIDDYKKEELSNFEAIILYNYKYHSKKRAFLYLENYLKNGGKVFIETGSEVKENNSFNLPEFFPVDSLTKTPLGEDFEFSLEKNSITSGVLFSEFSKAIYQQYPWGISYPPSEENIRGWAKSVLKNHGHSVLISGNYGKGKIVWSGLNLPYHILHYNNLNESELFKNIIKELFPLEKAKPATFSVKRPESEKIIVKFQDAKGILFKENYLKGWKTSFPIYEAGLGFMYIKIPSEVKGSREVKISYFGSPYGWFSFFFLLIVSIFTLDYLIFKGRILRLFKLDSFSLWTSSKIRRLWHEEEDE